MTDSDEIFMFRCLELARLGAGYVAPNPMVGAVLVYNNRIIGEGYHKKYGQAHAEVNCINSVNLADKHLIEKSILYVSLEPCNHFGKTPPCTDLILSSRIQKVVIGCQDVYNAVNGKGIEKLKSNNIDVTVGMLEKECQEINKRFFTFHLLQRPYVILKWAQTFDNKIAYNNDNRLKITNKFTNKLVHKWRFEEAGILIGTNTAFKDNPVLTNRFWSGCSPVRLVLDLNLKLPKKLNIFNKDASTIIFNYKKNNLNVLNENLENGIYYYQLNETENIPVQILKACYELKIQSVLIEGGQKLLQTFIDDKLWDEARIITNESKTIGEGLSAPVIGSNSIKSKQHIYDDLIQIIKK